MNVSLLSLVVRSRRDVLVARQRARQIAGLLGFDERQRGSVAAAVFDMACHCNRRQPVRFLLKGDALHIGRLAFSLPDPTATPPRHDIPWLVQVLHQMTPLNVFEEIRRQNRDLLLALREIRTRRAA